MKNVTGNYRYRDPQFRYSASGMENTGSEDVRKTTGWNYTRDHYDVTFHSVF